MNQGIIDHANTSRDWLPLTEFENWPTFQKIGWNKSAMIGAGKAGFLEIKFDSKLRCYTTTLENLKLALKLRNIAMDWKKVELCEIDEKTR